MLDSDLQCDSHSAGFCVSRRENAAHPAFLLGRDKSHDLQRLWTPLAGEQACSALTQGFKSPGFSPAWTDGPAQGTLQ